MRLVQGQFKQRGKAFVASLLVCLVLLLDAMAAAPSLHELFHADAGKADHQCAVTLFAHGQVDSATVDVSVSAPMTFAVVAPQVEISVFAPAIENLPAGRAPPVSSSNS
jgi:hypothetical protein